MRTLTYLLPALACPAGMGVMMWLMMRGNRHDRSTGPEAETRDGEIARLRQELDELTRRDGASR